MRCGSSLASALRAELGQVVVDELEVAAAQREPRDEPEPDQPVGGHRRLTVREDVVRSVPAAHGDVDEGAERELEVVAVLLRGKASLE